MKVKTRVLLEDCIKEGIDYGYTKAHKHTDNPEEQTILNSIQHSIMEKIYEYFSFDEDEWN